MQIDRPCRMFGNWNDNDEHVNVRASLALERSTRVSAQRSTLGAWQEKLSAQRRIIIRKQRAAFHNRNGAEGDEGES